MTVLGPDLGGRPLRRASLHLGAVASTRNKTPSGRISRDVEGADYGRYVLRSQPRDQFGKEGRPGVVVFGRPGGRRHGGGLAGDRGRRDGILDGGKQETDRGAGGRAVGHAGGGRRIGEGTKGRSRRVYVESGQLIRLQDCLQLMLVADGVPDHGVGYGRRPTL